MTKTREQKIDPTNIASRLGVEMSETKPREFWVSPIHRFVAQSPKDIPKSVKFWDEKPIHVVEKSALDQAQARIAELEAENQALKQTTRVAIEQMDSSIAGEARAEERIAELEREYAASISVVNQYGAKIGELQAKCADYERALEFYADLNDELSCMYDERGVGVAREALEKWRKNE